jgi:hypothetical protein
VPLHAYSVVEKLMHQSGFAKAPGPCITDVWVHGDGKFGFLEFRTVEVCLCGLLSPARFAACAAHPRAGMQRIHGTRPI